MLAQHDTLDHDADEAARVRLAARAGTPPEVLRELAADPSITVRAAVAMNAAFAPSAHDRLVADSDERVRALLAGKIARLLPGLSGAEHAAAQAHVERTLSALAGDAAERVRIALSEALVSMPEAPRAVVLALARDPVLTVSGPIVRFSPLLTDADLLDLLATPAHPAIPAAVARRVGLSGQVADRIAVHADGAAVRALLANDSATIREATLDALIGRAADHPEWHEPLVRRPALPVRAALALSRIVAGHLLQALTSRTDLPADTTQALQAHLDGLAPPLPTEAEVMDGVRALCASGQLNEAALIDAAEAGENRQLAALLAVASGMAISVLDRAVALRSAKALVSLVWKAGFSMRAATAVQVALGQLGPGLVLQPTATGEFPLSPDEMDWQIELLGEPGR